MDDTLVLHEPIIIAYDPGTTFTKYYVYVPESDPEAWVTSGPGSYCIRGNMIKKFKTYYEAEQFVIAHKKR